MSKHITHRNIVRPHKALRFENTNLEQPSELPAPNRPAIRSVSREKQSDSSRSLCFVKRKLRNKKEENNMPEVIKFGPGSCKNELWIKNKTVFSKPKRVDVEFTTAGAFDWVVADKNGKEVKKIRHANPSGGWTGLDFPSLGLYQDYSIGFRNASTGEKKLKQGTVNLTE